LNSVSDIVPLSETFFRDEPEFDEEGRALLAEAHVPAVLESFLKQAQQAEQFTPEAIQAMLKSVQKETGYKGKQLFMPVRVALTGHMHGRDLNQTLALLGQSRVVAQLQKLL
jgi:nondiscriminating glutamyl-tRNA synthetase